MSTVDARQLDKLSAVTVVLETEGTNGIREVRVTLQPTEQDQRVLAALTSRQASQGIGGQFNVEYGMKRLPDAGDVVVKLTASLVQKTKIEIQREL